MIKVIKRNGNTVPFERQKINNAILKAYNEVYPNRNDNIELSNNDANIISLRIMNCDDEKIDVRRVPNGNLNYVNYIKDVSEMSTVILTVTKSDMDNEIITPNKEYLVNNYSSYSEYNGNYILSFKKETFVQQSNDFVCATVFGLRKANG